MLMLGKHSVFCAFSPQTFSIANQVAMVTETLIMQYSGQVCCELTEEAQVPLWSAAWTGFGSSRSLLCNEGRSVIDGLISNERVFFFLATRHTDVA